MYTDRWHRRVGFVVFTISLCLLAASGRASAAPEAICSTPAVVYCDNFDDRSVGYAGLLENIGPKTQAWDMSQDQSVRVSNNIAFSGANSMIFDYPACSWQDNQSSACGTGSGIAHPQLNLSEFYARHYVYWAPGFVWSPIADKHMAFLDSAGQRAPWAFHTMGGSGTPEHIYEPIDPPHYDQNVNLPAVAWQTGRWYCLEIHIKQGAGNAILEGWIDGVQKWSYTNANFPNAWTGTNAGLMVSGYWNTFVTPGSRGAQQRYIDNIVVSTQRIGCLGGGGQPASGQTTPPNAPASVNAR